MAGASLFTLLDDLATLLDDIAVLSKVAGKKTAGVLADDLALNAEQVSGVAAKRELPIVWAVFKGSLLNKVILVPLALLISAFAPWLITPLLMAGGLFLCFEGVEKLLHKTLHGAEEVAHEREELTKAAADPDVDMVSYEKDKIRGAIRTDFILSAEIIVIALGTVATQPLATQVGVLSLLALALTMGVYGFVALIVKLDDIGLYLSRLPEDRFAAGMLIKLGDGLVWLAPNLMKLLSIAGTAAMFLVGGGILVHGIGYASDLLHQLEHWLQAQGVGGFWEANATKLFNALVGLIAGAIALAVVTLASRLWSGRSSESTA